MEGQNGSSLSHQTTENGFKRKPPYSVETPYGFRLDLDFLKYVDDIEKGNTIKRVPIQRRSKGPRSSTLPRHINLSGGGYRPSPWGSTGALGPRSRVTDFHQGYTSVANDHRTPVSPTGFRTLTEMEARIKAFDEQPLGEHIRPNLLRASSLPLTVLLRQSSESTDDPGSLRSSRDQLGGRDTSCEDVCYSPENSSDIPLNQDFSGLLRRLTEALERVGELETEIRVIPELKAQICMLQEERERLRLGLSTPDHPTLVNGTKDCRTSSSYHSSTGIKRLENNGCVTFPQNHSGGRGDQSTGHEWRTSTDLDELLTVTSLQAKVAVLEQKLHESGLDLQRALRMLREQKEESRGKDEKLEGLSRNPGIGVRAERAAVDQDGDDRKCQKAHSFGNWNVPYDLVTSVFSNGQRSREQGSGISSAQTSTRASPPVPMELEEAAAGGPDPAAAARHVWRVKTLLEEQWEHLCGGMGTAEKKEPPQHPDPKVNSLQKEMVDLVHVLCSRYPRHDGPHGAPRSTAQGDRSTRTSKSLSFAGVNDGHKTTEREELKWELPDPEQTDVQAVRKETAAAPREKRMEGDARPRARPGPGPGPGPGQLPGAGEVESRQADGGGERVFPKRADQMGSPPAGEQMESGPGSVSPTRGRDAVGGDFMSSCLFLNDHMDNMDNPNEDMRRALVVLFQSWFSVAAEEKSAAVQVAVYLGRVRKATPSLLAFLINLADDNGNTALHYSVSHCNYDIVTLILDTGASEVDLQNKAGYTAVMLASLTAPDGPGGMEVVRRLMELGNVNIRSNQTGQTALQLAVRHGRVVMVRMLLSCGADADVQDGHGTTALMFACERGHTHIARLLLERCHCDLTLTDKRGRTALSLAVQGAHSDTASLIQAHAKARGL